MNLVESGGVYEELALGTIYDVSAHNDNQTFNSLSDLLNNPNLSTLIPSSIRKGGMSIKFIETSDNKYLQYRYMLADVSTATTFTNVANWVCIEEEVKEIHDILIETVEHEVPLTEYNTATNLYCNTQGVFAVPSSEGYNIRYFSVVGGKKYKYHITTGNLSSAIVLLSYGTNVPALNVSGNTIIEMGASSADGTFTPQSNGYLSVQTRYLYTCEIIEVTEETINVLDNIEEEISQIDGSVNALQEDVDNINEELTEDVERETTLTEYATVSDIYCNNAGKFASANGYGVRYYNVVSGRKYKYHITGALSSSLVLLSFGTSVPASGVSGNTKIEYGAADVEGVFIPQSNGYLSVQTRYLYSCEIIEVVTEEVSRLDSIENKITKISTIYVATTGDDTIGDGSKDNPFATIYHANSTIVDASENHQYIIKVADGIYTDLQSRYAGSTPSSYEGVSTKNYVTYEGNVKHPENVIIEWDGGTGYSQEIVDASTFYDTYGFYKCPFHVNGETNTVVKGFTFDCKNTRYSFHIEMGGHGWGANWLVSDCIMKWHGVPSRDVQPAAIGTGSGHFEKGHLLRCMIYCDEGIPNGFMNHDSLYLYDNNVFREGSEITIESCKFNCGTQGATSIYFRNIHSDNLVDGYNRVNLINCVGINVFGYIVSGSATQINWRAKTLCSDITTNQFKNNGKEQ